MKKKEFRIKYVKNNNTILIERNMNLYQEEKGSRPSWHWWYEIDMDDSSLSRLDEWKEHLLEKVWVTENRYILDEVNELYQFHMYPLNK